ncbi:beta-1,4-N-acetylgalactosaminyltransferase bre-4-like [Mya arenaria]|uniref:beta-1,4-N-acetylgalactosaminyltransferase bre-4-like n=1 Tax=Mya arenaria TaxID=6604 RepID=UPI0022E20336|nr:beta-1,4-N-acetylgalactosaminyltransferase bre-4-like [Mya arenaria]XP_052811464.1 beta-1,4-N-acetylgalactosaminyltransferase bre-4-like [Mya arenaria]
MFCLLFMLNVYLKMDYPDQIAVIRSNWTRVLCDQNADGDASGHVNGLKACCNERTDFKGRLESSLSQDNLKFPLIINGTWKPASCNPVQHVAVIIPFRNREEHLHILLKSIIPILVKQKVHLHIFVAEQYGNQAFNKGRVMNAAFLEVSKMSDFDCFIFHDVDLIPEDDRITYLCDDRPKHMSPSVDVLKYMLLYQCLVGGVIAFPPAHFIALNGYSNLYWGWGAEDDDMSYRIMSNNNGITRQDGELARYKMIKHEQSEMVVGERRYTLLGQTKDIYEQDGLNSVQYDLISVRRTHYYTHLMINVGPAPSNTDSIDDIIRMVSWKNS